MYKVDYVGEPWIGVDLDGTLAHYSGWKGEEHIGEPIPEMLERVKVWLSEGKRVKIFTARAADTETAVARVKKWCAEVGLPELEITCVKDYSMVELWDDRSVQVIPNTGTPLDTNRR